MILAYNKSPSEIKELENFILSRFQPRQPEADIVKGVKTVIESAISSNPDIFRDIIHYHLQTKGLQSLIGSTSSYFSDLFSLFSSGKSR